MSSLTAQSTVPTWHAATRPTLPGRLRVVVDVVRAALNNWETAEGTQGEREAQNAGLPAPGPF